jgi:hypothetical protein
LDLIYIDPPFNPTATRRLFKRHHLTFALSAMRPAPDTDGYLLPRRSMTANLLAERVNRAHPRYSFSRWNH